jgi:hypothetical protein
MSDPSTKDVKNLIERLKNIDVTRVEEDENVKGEALALARKITSTLEGPINRATDLMFRVCATTACRIVLATYKKTSSKIPLWTHGPPTRPHGRWLPPPSQLVINSCASFTTFK